MTEYEIKCNQSWAWYSGYVTDYSPEQKKFFVRFPDDWKEPYWEDPSHVRPLPDPIDLNAWVPRRGEEAECQAKAEENEPYGWWGCIIQNVQNQVYSVKFDGWDEMHNEKLEKSLLRPKNAKKPISLRDIQRKSITVDPKLVDWVNSKPKDLEQIKKRPRLIHLGYDTKSKSLIIIATKRIIDQCEQLIKLHFEKQSNLMQHEAKTKHVEAELAKRKKIEENALKAQFRVHPFLTGHVLGRKRLNTLKKEIPDLINVTVEDGLCTISAGTQYALDSALDQLYVVAHKILIPQEEMRYVIGKKGENIQHLRKSVDVSRIVTYQNWPQEFDKMKQRLLEREHKIKSKQQQQQQKNIKQQQTPRNRNKQQQEQEEEDIDESNELDDNLFAPEIQNVQCDDLFDEKEGDIIDLCSNQVSEEYKDALIIIGRKSKVELCTSMIELTLNYLTKLTESRYKIEKLREDLSLLRGYPPPPSQNIQSNYNNNNNNVEDFKEEIPSTQAQTQAQTSKNKNIKDKDNNNNNNNNNNRNKEKDNKKTISHSNQTQVQTQTQSLDKNKSQVHNKNINNKKNETAMEIKESKSKRKRNRKAKQLHQQETEEENIHGEEITGGNEEQEQEQEEDIQHINTQGQNIEEEEDEEEEEEEEEEEPQQEQVEIEVEVDEIEEEEEEDVNDNQDEEEEQVVEHHVTEELEEKEVEDNNKNETMGNDNEENNVQHESEDHEENNSPGEQASKHKKRRRKNKKNQGVNNNQE